MAIHAETSAVSQQAHAGFDLKMGDLRPEARARAEALQQQILAGLGSFCVTSVTDLADLVGRGILTDNDIAPIRPLLTSFARLLQEGEVLTDWGALVREPTPIYVDGVPDDLDAELPSGDFVVGNYVRRPGRYQIGLAVIHRGTGEASFADPVVPAAFQSVIGTLPDGQVVTYAIDAIKSGGNQWRRVVRWNPFNGQWGDVVNTWDETTKGRHYRFRPRLQEVWYFDRETHMVSLTNVLTRVGTSFFVSPEIEDITHLADDNTVITYHEKEHIFKEYEPYKTKPKYMMVPESAVLSTSVLPSGDLIYVDDTGDVYSWKPQSMDEAKRIYTGSRANVVSVKAHPLEPQKIALDVGLYLRDKIADTTTRKIALIDIEKGQVLNELTQTRLTPDDGSFLVGNEGEIFWYINGHIEIFR